MAKKYDIIALIGPAGSGKDFILGEVLAAADSTGLFNEIISATTRPPRQGEIDGKNYHFLTVQEFGDKVVNMEMLEACEFNGWFYGTPTSSLDENKINIGVFNPDGIRAMSGHPEINQLLIFYIEVKDKTRLLRQLNREEDPDVDEIIRRWKTDKFDFDELDFGYNTLRNESGEDGLLAAAAITKVAKQLKAQDKKS